MFSVKIPDIENMNERQRVKAVKEWMQSVNIQTRQELQRLERLITEGKKNGVKHGGTVSCTEREKAHHQRNREDRP